VRLSWLVVVGLLPAALVCADIRAEAGRYLLDQDRRELSRESQRLQDLTRQLDAALSELSQASRAVEDAAPRSDQELSDASGALRRAAAALDDALLSVRLSTERILTLKRRIDDLQKEISGARAPAEDVLSGSWTLRIDPGEQGGQMQLTLDGTLVSGSYSLDGGFHGSFRGTLVGDRVRLERIDSRLGLNAVYFGRLSRGGASLVGTWEATDLSVGPTSGTWSAQKKTQDEEER
jgi:hypothetical protein